MNFALMPASELREIAKRGGEASSVSSKARRWSREEARAAGRASGEAKRRRREEQEAEGVE